MGDSVLATDFIAQLPVTQGAGAGEPFQVFPWERKLLGKLERETDDLALSIARGNGKSTFAAAIGAACLWGPLAVPRGEVVIVASAFAQARIVFEHLVSYLPSRSGFRVWDSQNAAKVIHKESGASVVCIGADPRRAHGRAPVLAILDEPAQWPRTTSDAMLAALRTALGKQPGSRLLAIGTQPAAADHWFSKMLRRDGAMLYAARPDDPIAHRRTWKRANPSLDFMPWLEDRIRQEAAEAKADPAMLAAFRALRLNLGVSDVEASLLLDAGTWERAERIAERLPGWQRGTGRQGPYVLGLDLGGSAAMSSAAGYWPETGLLDAFACFAEEPSLEERGLRDGVGRLYRDMENRHELFTAGQHVADPVALLTEVLHRWGKPAAIVADRYREAELRQVLSAAGFPPTALQTRGQGYRDGGEDVRRFRAAVGRGNVVPVRSLLLRSAMGEARVLTDPAGNSKLAKSGEGGRRSTARDDAAAASILAVAEGDRKGRIRERGTGHVVIPARG